MQGSWDMIGQQDPTGPALWSAEEPNLYILVLTLLSPDGSHIESESCQVYLLQQPTIMPTCAKPDWA